MGSYINKASMDLYMRGADKMASYQSNPKTTYFRGKDDKIILNRLKGIDRASNKLVKLASPKDKKGNTIRGASADSTQSF